MQINLNLLKVELPPEIYRKYRVGFGHESVVEKPHWAYYEPDKFARVVWIHNLVCLYAEKFPKLGEKFRRRKIYYYDMLIWAEEYFLGAIKYK